mmetsp:Transcript_66633/g.195502  ORF Transcript_66633/g.195502 Transcript_66633/m.195502 type:complete len:205 (+) Transcript_66633:7036-7650(+)
MRRAEAAAPDQGPAPEGDPGWAGPRGRQPVAAGGPPPGLQPAAGVGAPRGLPEADPRAVDVREAEPLRGRPGGPVALGPAGGARAAPARAGVDPAPAGALPRQRHDQDGGDAIPGGGVVVLRRPGGHGEPRGRLPHAQRPALHAQPDDQHPLPPGPEGHGHPHARARDLPRPLRPVPGGPRRLEPRDVRAGAPEGHQAFARAEA